MIITKALAPRIARKLISKKEEELDLAHNEFKDFVKETYVKTIPEEVLSLYKKFPDYFYTPTININVLGSGIVRGYQISVNGEWVLNNSGNYYAVLEVKGETADKIVNLKNKYEKLKNKYKSDLDILTNVLINIRTSKRLEKELPEAVQFLPQPKMEVAINYDHIKKLFKF